MRHHKQSDLGILVVVQLLSYMWLCDPMNCSTPGFSVLHHLPEFVQTHVRWVSDAIQPSHPLLPPSPFALYLSQHQGFSNELALHIRWPKYWSFSLASVLPMNTQGWLPLGLTGLISLLSKELSEESSPAPQIESVKSLAISLLYGPTVIFIHDYWKNLSFDYMDIVGKVMCLVFNALSRLFIAVLPRSKHLLVLWLQLPSQWFWSPRKWNLTFSPSICHEVIVPDTMILVFWMLSFKPAFSLSSFTFMTRFFSSSPLSVFKVVSSAYLRLLIFLPAVLIQLVIHPAQHFMWCTLHIS